jgi:hypothetical protein
MATTKQIEANRANAKKSTGPVTDEGKKCSSRNSTRHGLTSQDVFVPPGLTHEFDALKSDLHDELQPETALQLVFFNQALAASWKQIRCERAEAELADKVTEPGTDPLSDPKLESTIRTIERARAQANRLLNNALQNFRKAKSDERARHQPDLFADLGLNLQNEADLLAELLPDPLLTPEVKAAFEKLQADPKGISLDYPELVDFMDKFRKRQDETQQTNPIVQTAAA